MNQIIHKDEIVKLIPHSGKMCLLDNVICWDENILEAESTSYAKIDNPLRLGNSVASIHGVEYAAQAVAIHISLCKKKEGTSSSASGYLATVRDIQILVDKLHDDKIIENSPLKINIMILMETIQAYTYQFSISGMTHETSKNKLILTGKITVFLT